MTVFNIGSLNIDYVYSVSQFVKPGETIASEMMEIFPGGKGLNQSIALARAGSKVVHCGLIGKDGQFLKDVLAQSGVDTKNIMITDSPTGHAIIQVDTNGQNCILLYAGANRTFTDEYIDSVIAKASSGDILVLQNEINGLEHIFDAAAVKKLDIAFNPSPFDDSILKLPLQRVKWWFCNELEAEYLFGSGSPEEICRKFTEKYPESNLILTLGKDGAIFKNRDMLLRQPIFKVDTVDTTAAGDTFSGYFISAVAQGNDIKFALEFAAKASSITVSRKGASSSIPYAQEVI